MRGDLQRGRVMLRCSMMLRSRLSCVCCDLPRHSDRESVRACVRVGSGVRACVRAGGRVVPMLDPGFGQELGVELREGRVMRPPAKQENSHA